jgi:hypothetical protein
MIRFLHALDMRSDRAMFLGQELGEQVLLLRRANNEDRAGVGDRLRDILEEWLVLSDPVTGQLLPGMKVANDVIPDRRLVRLFDVEVDDTRPLVIDPDDGVIMIGHCGLPARIGV